MEISNVGKVTVDERGFHLGGDEGPVPCPGGHDQWAGAEKTQLPES